MAERRTKSIQSIEEKMEGMGADTLRYRILQNVKNFKTSWIDLGQALYTVWKDKLYKDWGYNTFDAYTAKEIGVRKQTALKLLRSYYFLEKEEPFYLKKEFSEERSAASVPTYESINVLRLASNKNRIDREDYTRMKKNVLEEGRDSLAVKKDLTKIIKSREELEPEEAWQKRKISLLKRYLSLLRSLKREIQVSKMFPAQMTGELDKIIKKLETELT